MRVLVTGAAGFIGSATTHRLLEQGEVVIGLDNLNAYYDPALKEARLAEIRSRDDSDRFEFIKVDIADREAMESLFETARIDRVVHLAAQAGVRYSIDHPHDYASSNITGFLNVLEGCRHQNIEHLLYASTSSVYGSDTGMPFSEHRGGNHPVSFYAATKRANELMAHSYANLYGLPCTGLRFFTVYGPWGRPDMALFLFTKAILAGKPINVFNHGNHQRDFTYVDDIVSGLIHALARPATANNTYDPANPDPATSNVPWRIYNIGNGQPVDLMHFINVLESKLGRKADINNLPMQPGDVMATWSNMDDLSRDFDYTASTSVEEGVEKFVDWYVAHYGKEPSTPTP
ncbi:MAG: NAD-dependent epimerase [Phycisphaerales bacterium]|jgi:UDP-glucuronate 4-epimerase|nr:NAD-dependent epimerase [Phycisphaerales bacterium]